MPALALSLSRDMRLGTIRGRTGSVLGRSDHGLGAGLLSSLDCRGSISASDCESGLAPSMACRHGR